MPHRRPHDQWKHLRDAICLNDGSAIEEVLQANDIDVEKVAVEFALIQAKKIGKDACELVDEARFKGAIAELISEISGKEVEADEAEWDSMFHDMVSVAAGEMYGPDIFMPGSGPSHYSRDERAAWDLAAEEHNQSHHPGRPQITRPLTPVSPSYRDILNTALAGMELRIGEMADAIRQMGERGVPTPVIERVQEAAEAVAEAAGAVEEAEEELTGRSTPAGVAIRNYLRGIGKVETGKLTNEALIAAMMKVHPELGTLTVVEVNNAMRPLRAEGFSLLARPRGRAPAPTIRMPLRGKARVVADYLISLGADVANTDLPTFIAGINAANPEVAIPFTEADYHSTRNRYPDLPRLGLRAGAAAEPTPPPVIQAEPPPVQSDDLLDLLGGYQKPERIKALLPAAMEDASEETRRRLQQAINAGAYEREELEQVAMRMGFEGKVWDTQELSADFEVLGFLAPFVVVVRKSDSQRGSLLFQHYPRYYWGFTPDVDAPGRQRRNGGSWSRKYFPGLTEAQHEVNDAWFQGMLDLLKPDGIIGIPTLQRAFNKQGEEIPWPGESEIRPNRVTEDPPSERER
jgi:hypothetical protein